LVFPIVKRVLIFTHSADYRHSYIPTAVEVLVKLSLASGSFDTYVTEEVSELSKEFINSFDALVFLTSGEVPASDDVKRATVDFVEGGGGFVGVHNATATLYSFPLYGRMLGGYFHSHPWQQEVQVIVRNRNHPATQHLPERFKVLEEVYVFRDFVEENTEVLIELDTSSVDMSKAPKEVRVFPMAWCRKFGNGRVFYTAFGHFTKIWREKWFQQHLLGGILWVLGLNP
jgi:type 1 glutamine amidotransferase